MDRDKRVDELWEKRDFEGLIELLEHGDGKTPGWAAWALGSLGDQRAVEPLLRRLRRIDLSTATGDEQVEWTRLASALGYVADAGSPAADELVQVLRRPAGGGAVFFAAVEALAEMGDRRAIETCLRRLDGIDFGALSDDDERDAEYAIEALGTLEASEAVGPLISALETENASVRELAAYALGEIGDPRAVPALATLLKSEPGFFVENACLVALDGIGTDEAWAAMTLPPPDEPESR